MELESIKNLVDNTKQLSGNDLIDSIYDLKSFLDSVINITNSPKSICVELVRNNSPLLVDPDVIVIKNIFQLHFLLKTPLTVTHSYGDVYQVHATYRSHQFVEVINKKIYDEIYKDISTTVSEHEVFFPGR